jgi:hypothetical protein
LGLSKKGTKGLVQGRAFETLPAALVLVAGDRRVLLAVESAQHALYNVVLYAQAKGIGSRIRRFAESRTRLERTIPSWPLTASP